MSNPLYSDTNAYGVVRNSSLLKGYWALLSWAGGGLPWDSRNVKILVREQPGPAVISCKFVDESASAKASAAQNYWSPCSPSLASLMLELGPLGR